MKTIELKITNDVDVLKLQRDFNAEVRYAFNRFQEGLKEKDVRYKCKDTFNNEKSWFLQCAIKDAQMVFNKYGNDKIIFGGKANLIKYLKGQKSKDEYCLDKLRPIFIQGETMKKGNRSFEFHFDEDYLVYKPSKGMCIRIEYSKMHKNIFKQLLKIQELANQKKIAVGVKLDSTKQKLSLVFDEKLISEHFYKNLKSNRVIGLDLNPNTIGLSVLEFNRNNSEDFKVLYKEVISLYELTKKEITSNKRKYELIKVCYHIDKLIDVWKCKSICVEDLNIKSSNRGSGKTFNRLCNNVWHKNLVTDKLKMLASTNQYSFIEINSCFSSFIGNLINGNENTPDMVAASIEVARRGFNKYNKGHFYPKFDIETLDEQWKQTLRGVKDWKEAFYKVKESGLKYRFLLVDYIYNAVFRKFYIKSKIELCSFV